MVLSCVIKMSKIRSQETHDEHLLKKKKVRPGMLR